MEAPHLGEDLDVPVVLRPLRTRDVGALVDLSRDRAFVRWVDTSAPLEAPLEPRAEQAAAQSYIARAALGWAREDLFALAVELDGRCAGTVTVRPLRAGGARVGCALAPWARGRGAASSAVRLALTWAFAEHGAAVAHWRAEVGNWPARRVAWACGMPVEGTVRGLLVRRDERVDGWTGSVRWDEPLRPRAPWLSPVPLRAATADGGPGPGSGAGAGAGSGAGSGSGTGSVHLGPLRPGDVHRIAQACADPVTQGWLPDLPSPYTVADAIAFVATREEEHASARGVYWAVRDHEDGPLTGTTALFRMGPGARSGEVGYWVHPDAVGRGVATAAARAVLEHALAPTASGGLGLARVVLRASSGNTASLRVAQKAGFTAVGVERDAERLRDGTVTDLVVHDAVASARGARSAVR